MNDYKLAIEQIIKELSPEEIDELCKDSFIFANYINNLLTNSYKPENDKVLKFIKGEN